MGWLLLICKEGKVLFPTTSQVAASLHQMKTNLHYSQRPSPHYPSLPLSASYNSTNFTDPWFLDPADQGSPPYLPDSSPDSRSWSSKRWMVDSNCSNQFDSTLWFDSIPRAWAHGPKPIQSSTWFRDILFNLEHPINSTLGFGGLIWSNHLWIKASGWDFALFRGPNTVN